MFNKKEKTKLERYEDVTGEFTSSELRWGEWYVRHKILLHKILVRTLLVWCIATVGYSLGYFVYYYSYGYFQDEKMASQQITELSNLKNTNILFQARDLQFGNIEVYNSVSKDLFDFSARVVNPNERIAAIVTYKFVFSGGETELAQTILLPGSKRPIAYFGFESNSYPANPRIVIEDVTWKRISTHLIEDPTKFIADRTNFLVENFQYTRSSRSEGIPNNILEFDIFNNTAYNYWEPAFYIELIRGNRTVGIIYYLATEFRAREKRHVDLRSYIENFEVSNIKVWPTVNVFDDNEYLPIDY